MAEQTITKSEKDHITQQCRFIIDTYPDKMRKLELELREYKMAVDDAKERMKEVNDMEVVG